MCQAVVDTLACLSNFDIAPIAPGEKMNNRREAWSLNPTPY